MTDARSPSSERLLRAAFLVLLVAGSVALIATSRHVRVRHTDATSDRTMALPDGRMARIASMGYERLTSDFYWLVAIQYFGTPANAKVGYRELFPLLDLVTDLDPDFAFAYRFGGVTVPYHGLESGWQRGDKAIALLEKGTRHVECDWNIWMVLGYSRLWFNEDVDGAADAMEHAARCPRRPEFIPLLATRLRAQAGKPEIGVALAQALLADTQEPELRAELERRIRDLQVEAVLQATERGAKAFKESHGRFPVSLGELIAAGLVPSLAGSNLHISLDPRTGKATADELPRRVLLPPKVLREIEQQRGAAPKEKTRTPAPEESAP